MSSHYIVPNDMLRSAPPTSEWHATGIAGDPLKSLVVVLWDNPNAEVEFESRPGVLQLGKPWEDLPPEAVALLSPVSPVAPVSGIAAPSIVTDPPPVADTVHKVLKNLGWPGSRL